MMLRSKTFYGAMCTSLYWASSACTKGCPFERLGLKWRCSLMFDSVKGDNR